MAVLKFPPPPDMGRDNQRLNRWLIEIQRLLNTEGLIDPSQIVDLPGTYVQVGDNTVDIANLTSIVNALGEIVAINTVNIAALQSSVAALAGRVDALEARGEVLNGAIAPVGTLGKINDWYADTVLGNIYVKTGVATWTVIV